MLKGLPRALVTGFVLIVLAAAIVLVGIYTFLMPVAERMVARNVQNQLGLEERPQVKLESDSLPEMLAGEFSGGRISLGSVDLGDVRAGRIDVDLDPFDLDVLGSLRGSALTSERPLSGMLRAEVPEGEASRLTRAEADAPVRDIELEEDRVLVKSEASVPGFDVPVSVLGSLALRGGALVFEPRLASALGTPVPEQLLVGADFSCPLRGLPRGVQITGVEVIEGRLILSGEMERIPMNQPIG